MDIEILLNDKRIYETQQEIIFSSSQLHSTFPRQKKSEDFGTKSWNSDRKCSISDSIIPNLIVPLSKYSSTETEDSGPGSEDDYYCGENRGSVMLSEFSASATSSTNASRQMRIRRRRRKRKSKGLSASTLSINSNGSNGSVGSRDGCRGLSFLELNSVKDLEHAIGRHRGVSGSDSPSIDATIFGMFYMTDIFDSLFLTDPIFSRASSNNYIQATAMDIRALLRKEIVYSLRVNYYCPSNKISKLIKMIEEHSPVDKFEIGDVSIPTFLKILSGEILNLSPFLSFSNGSNGYVFPLLVEPRLGMSSQQQVHTLQNLLSGEFSSEISGFGKPFRGDRIKFLTVPYPALLIEVIRTQDVTLSPSSSSSSSSSHRSNNHEPVIPNLELDISPFITPVGGKAQPNIIRDTSTPSFYTSCNSIANASFMSSASFTNSEGSFLYEYDRADPVPKESRLVKGLKSAWKVMFQYLEDFTVSTHISPDSIVDNGRSSATTSSSITRTNENDNYDDSSGQLWYNEASSSYIHHQPWYVNTSEGRTSRSSSVSLGKPRSYLHSSSATLASLSSRPTSTPTTPTPTLQTPIRMELIGVICISNKSESGRNGRRFSPSYSVYCKAGKDTQSRSVEETGLFAPWVLFEPQKGVAPQVTLIENCGKWLSFLEHNADNLVLSNVPLEIRRMLTESSLFIYNKID